MKKKYDLARPHLFAAVASLGLVAGILFAGRAVALHIENATTDVTVSQDFSLKNQGLAFQRAAAQRDNILLLYGSSELTGSVSNRASHFFASAPTGFEVCPIGRKGFTCLSMLQRIAALGGDVRNHKIAVSISPSFFFHDEVNPDSYAGNFSLEVANGAIFGDGLSWPLKRQLAQRMQQFPGTLSKSVLLSAAVNALAAGDSLGWLRFAAILPLGKLENVIYEMQDHFEAMTFLANNTRRMERREAIERDPEPQLTRSRLARVPAIASHGEEEFRDRLGESAEWIDIELLFRVLKQLRTRAFIVSLPLRGAEFDSLGVPLAARKTYYNRLRALAEHYEIPVQDFEDHDTDTAFQLAQTEHPSSEGWKFYDAALDRFFHQPKRYVLRP